VFDYVGPSFQDYLRMDNKRGSRRSGIDAKALHSYAAYQALIAAISTLGFADFNFYHELALGWFPTWRDPRSRPTPLLYGIASHRIQGWGGQRF
jgi:hypothetical protein